MISHKKLFQLDPSRVFTNSELRLTDIEIIGFDYDYTLAPYTQALEDTIFNMIIEGLVSSRHYPSVGVTVLLNSNLFTMLSSVFTTLLCYSILT